MAKFDRLLRQHSEFAFRHPSKIINGRHKQRSGQHTLARQKIYEKTRKKFRMKRLRTFRTGVLSLYTAEIRHIQGYGGLLLKSR